MSKETLKQLDDTQGKMQKAQKAYEEALEVYMEARMANLMALQIHNAS